MTTNAPFNLEEALARALEQTDETFDRLAAEANARHEQQLAARRAETNRRNARKSTGPRSEAGKANSSKNRLAHGLCSNTLLIYGETQEQFDELRAQTHQTFAPATPEENFLTDQLTEALWRLHRARRVEAATYDIAMDITDHELSQGGTLPVDQSTPVQLAHCFFHDGHQKTFSAINRYVAAADRTYRQSLKALEQAIERRPAPVPVETITAQKEPQAPPAPVKLKVAAAGQSLYREEDTELPAWPAPAVPSIIDRC